MDYEINENPSSELRDYLWKNLMSYGYDRLSNSELEKSFSLSILAKDQGIIIGGLLAEMYFQGLSIDLLWIDENYRKSGIGKSLLLKAEEKAILTNCKFIYGNTFSFQAPDFYLKLGFEIFGKIENFPPGQTRFYLKKDI